MRVFAWPRSPEEDHVVAGEQRVLELRQDRVLVAHAPPGRAARRPGSGRWRCGAAPPSPGTDFQPDSRSWPRVAGAGCGARRGRSWAPTYRRPPRIAVPAWRPWRVRWHRPACCAVRLRWFLAMIVDPGRRRRPHRAWSATGSRSAGTAATRSWPARTTDGVDRRPPATDAPSPLGGAVEVTGTRHRRAPRAARCSTRARSPRRSPSRPTAGFGNGGEITGVHGRREAEHDRVGRRPTVRAVVGRLVLVRPALVDLDPLRWACRLVLGRRQCTRSPRARTSSTRPWPSARPGVATPRDAVTFEAGDELARFEAHGDAALFLGADQPPHRFVGPGMVHLEGTLERHRRRRHARGRSRASTSRPARSTSRLTPDGDGGWTVDGDSEASSSPTLHRCAGYDRSLARPWS